MHPITLETLLEADDADHVECPPHFDWESLRRRTSELKQRLETMSGLSFHLDDGAQDATFFGDLGILRRQGSFIETVFGLRFSNFGDLFTTCETSTEKLPAETASALIHAASEAGFKYVPPELLDLPYTGRHPLFAGSTWWFRYFDYT